MNDHEDNDARQRAEYLISNSEFMRLPSDIRRWILQSPSATTEFTEFFKSGGKFDATQKTGLPYYDPRVPPKIYIDKATYAAITGAGSEANKYIQLGVFSTLAHEIGHHKENTSNRLFPENGTEREYVQYRAGLEAKATFSAFPILAELKQSDPSFDPDWNQVGYLSGLDIGALYNRWTAGEDKELIIREMAGKIPSCSYGLANPPPDLDRDGSVTHRDAYIRDYREQRERIKNSQQRHMEPKAAHEGPRYPTPSAPAMQPPISRHPDPRDRNHPDHAMHESVRTKLCDLYAEQGLSIDGERLERLTAGVMADARRSQMKRVDLLEFSEDYDTGKADVNGNIIAFQGDPSNPASPYSATTIDQAIRTPTEDSYRQFDTATQQQAQQWDRFLTQEQELSQSRGMHRSL